ncbi:MAG: antitoxin MazE family protein [Amaricoccus sp.]|uniref:antitoxin MazE family protein n=1 Tax=Amaricoccus sp. TaxID=1872485 RepID=UPI0039E5F0F8
MSATVVARVRRRREALRAAGLRPVQIWVPDTRHPGFAEECRRQAGVVAAADLIDPDLGEFLDATLADAAGAEPGA